MRYLAYSLALSAALPLAADPRPASELETQIVMEAQTAFLRAREAGDAAARWQLLAPSLQAQVSEPQMAAMLEAERAEQGALAAFNPARMTAYPEQNAIVIDFVATYENDLYECGYVVWAEVEAGIRLTRIERAFLPFEARKTLSDEELFASTGCHALPPRQGG